MGILWTIIIGFVAGVVAKFLMPGPNEPSGFILTTILGIVGAFVASYLGQALGWYGPGEGAGLIGAVVGAIVVLAVWGAVSKNRALWILGRQIDRPRRSAVAGPRLPPERQPVREGATTCTTFGHRIEEATLDIRRSKYNSFKRPKFQLPAWRSEVKWTVFQWDRSVWLFQEELGWWAAEYLPRSSPRSSRSRIEA